MVSSTVVLLKLNSISTSIGAWSAMVSFRSLILALALIEQKALSMVLVLGNLGQSHTVSEHTQFLKSQWLLQVGPVGRCLMFAISINFMNMLASTALR